MLLRQLADGRCEVENQYQRVVRPEGNPAALAAIAETMELRTTFEWRGLGFISQSALKLAARVRRLGRRGPLRGARRPRRRPQGLPVRRGAEGRDPPLGVQGVRHRLHARAPDRHLHGLQRGRLRRLLQLRPPRADGGSARRSVRRSSEEVLEAIEARRRRPRRKVLDERITLAHGAGGKATPRPGRGDLRPRALQPAARRRSATAPWSAPARTELAFTTDSFVVRPLFFPGGDIGELAVNGTINDLAMTGATAAGALGRASSSRRACRSPNCERIAASMARGRRGAPASGSPPATPRSSSAARPTGSTSTPRASASSSTSASARPPRDRAPATRCSSPARSAITAWR